jgi:choline-sulfatase/uncharacterized sulfatase
MAPNVLFIIADQHNAKVLGHKGHPHVKTPNLDRLAAQGTRFENAITQNPICTPSRVSFLSGQYCHNHGYYGLGGPRPALPSVLGHFRRNGYRTAAVGKIHCPEYWVEDDCDLFREAYSGCSIGGCPEYSEYLRAKGVLNDRDDDRLQEQGNAPHQSCDSRPSRLKYEDCVEAWIVRESIAFMAKAKAEGKPFFIQASLPRPHQIFTPSEPFWSMYDESKLTLPPNADYDMKAAGKAPHLIGSADNWRQGKWTLFEPRTFAAGRMRKYHGYLGCVSQVDHAVGELMDWLRSAGLEEDTIVIYTADHGDYACEHGQIEKAPGICADAITRIPYIWRYPGKAKAGHVSQQIVETVDLSATVCALAGLDPLQTSDGKDISALLAGGDAPVHRVGVTEFAWSKSIRKGDWRLVYYPPEMFPQQHLSGFGELYNLKDDPWEMKNMYFDPRCAAKVKELERDLLDWLVSTTRPVTVLPHVRFDGDQAVQRYGNTTNGDGKISPARVANVAWRNYI